MESLKHFSSPAAAVAAVLSTTSACQDSNQLSECDKLKREMIEISNEGKTPQITLHHYQDQVAFCLGQSPSPDEKNQVVLHVKGKNILTNVQFPEQ